MTEKNDFLVIFWNCQNMRLLKQNLKVASVLKMIGAIVLGSRLMNGRTVLPYFLLERKCKFVVKGPKWFFKDIFYNSEVI